MSRLWLIRHGPTHARSMIGWTDRPADLSDKAALAALGARLPDAPVISSDLLRATATADAIAGMRPRLPHDPALREMNFGAWEGLHWAEAEARNPDIAAQLWSEPGDIAPPGGESWHQLRARVRPALERIAAQGDAIIVAHFGPILTALQLAGGWDTGHTLSHRIEPLSLSVVVWGGGIEIVNQPPNQSAL